MKYLQFAKTAVTTISIIAFVLVALVVAGSLIPVNGGYQIRIVESGSMEPAIPTGAAILTKVAPTYAVGDVVTFQRRGEDSPTTHRVLAVAGTTYTMQGDANNTPDLIPVQENELLGVVFFQIPFLGFVLDFVRQPLGFFILVGLPALWIVYEQALRIMAVVRQQKSTDNKSATTDKNV